MKVLIIDDSADFRALVRVHLTREVPGVEIEEYDPAERGRPADDYDWSRFDVLLLDYNLGQGEDGLEWLKAYRRRPDFRRPSC